ncbi:MAG: TFIIB-type zinc ribbon-containing protein [Anaerolineae bacterium]
MPVEAIQCPKCGSPLPVNPSAATTVCSYCGSSLRLTRGSSGHPLAMLDAIGLDTHLLAKQAALTHLRDRLNALQDASKKLDDWRSVEAEKAGRARKASCMGYLAYCCLVLGIGLLLLNLSTGDQSVALWPFAIVVFGGGIAFYAQHIRAATARQKRIHSEYEANLAQIRDEEKSLKARIAELHSSVDELSRKI